MRRASKHFLHCWADRESRNYNRPTVEAGDGQREGTALPAGGTIHLELALQMLFIVDDLERSVARMARFVAPGGAL